MSDYVVPVFVEAKMEYTNQMIYVLRNHVYEGFKSIYTESCDICIKKGNKQNRLNTFQTLLEQIPQWNQEIIETEYNRIIRASECDWFDDLVTAVFLAHTKILTSIGQQKGIESINLNIPRSSNFVHKIYINVARELWKNPYLFEHEISAHNYQKNIRDIELIITEGVNDTIRRLLPVKDILRDYLTLKEDENKKDDDDDDKDDDKDDKDKVSIGINKTEDSDGESNVNDDINMENITLPEPDVKEIPNVFSESNDPSTETTMKPSEEGIPGAIANAPSEGQDDTSMDTSGALPTVDTTIGGESHSELTDGDPTFQQTANPSEEKNISFEATGGDVNMSFDDGDSLDNLIGDAAKLVEKNDPEERNNIQEYLESNTTQDQNGEKIFSLFDDAAEIDEL